MLNPALATRVETRKLRNMSPLLDKLKINLYEGSDSSLVSISHKYKKKGRKII